MQRDGSVSADAGPKPAPDATPLPLRSAQECSFVPGDFDELEPAALINEAAGPIALCAAVQARLQRIENGLVVLEEVENDSAVGKLAFSLYGAVDEANSFSERLMHLLWAARESAA